MPRRGAAAGTAVEVRGYRKFRRDIRRMGKEAKRDLDRTMRGLAAPIAEDARRRYRRLHPRGRGRSKQSTRAIRARSTARGSAVLLGSRQKPWLQGQEFGSNQLQRFYPRSPNAPGGGSMGWFFYPAIRAGADEAVRLGDDVFRDLARRYFPE